MKEVKIETTLYNRVTKAKTDDEKYSFELYEENNGTYTLYSKYYHCRFENVVKENVKRLSTINKVTEKYGIVFVK